MLTESELFAAAFISYVFLYDERYRRFPHLDTYNRIVCLEIPGKIVNIKIENEISWEKIGLRDDTHSFIIKHIGVMDKREFRVFHYERSTELRFQNQANRFKIDERGEINYAEIESSDTLKIETESYPKTKYTFKFS